MKLLPGLLGLLLSVAAFQSDASACSRGGLFSFDEIFAADAIVRATAIEYRNAPEGTSWTTGKPKSTVAFSVEEVLKGKFEDKEVILNGYLGEEDDFNDSPMPYKFVRSNGRSGSCFANTYKKGAEFILFMKHSDEGWTTNISALGPTNEQLSDSEDPWLLWVRKEVTRREKASKVNASLTRLW